MARIENSPARMLRAGAAGSRIAERLDRLATHSAAEGALTRLYLTGSHRAAAQTVAEWMAEAGLTTRMDAAGNLIGRRDGARHGLPALMLGSHLDTVRDAGRYDGALGVIAAIEAVSLLGDAADTLPFALEIIAFGDEEGVRFPAALTGSRAVAGTLDPSVLDVTDEDGIAMRDALATFGDLPPDIGSAARRPDSVLGYLELHIEQGPVLEAEDLPVGIVTAIAGAERHVVEIAGVAGHAGTVPMDLRHDALTAASEMILAAETLARETEDLVATIGQIAASPGAVNVIPSGVRFSLDIRSPHDSIRHDAVAHLFARWQDIAARRAVSLTSRKTFEESAAQCDPSLTAALDDAVARAGLPIRHLPSGAGHDGLAMAALCPIAMLFLRCRGGISHNPAESILADDAGQAAIILADAIRHLAAARVLSMSRGAA